MDGYSGKRAIEGRPNVSRNSSGIVLRDRLDRRDQKAPICSRIDCRAEINPMKDTRICSSGKTAKSAGPSFRPSSNGKEIIETSSIKNDKNVLLYRIDTDSSDSSSVDDDSDVSELVLPLGSGNPSYRGVKTMKAESSSFPSSRRTRRDFQNRFGLGNPEAVVGSSSNQATHARKMNRYSLRNPRHNLILSDVVSSGFSSNSRLSRRKDTVKHSNLDGESSSSSSNKGKKMIRPQAEERICNPNHGVSIFAKNSPLNRDNDVSSVRTQRWISSYRRTRVLNHGSERNGLSSIVIPERPQPETSNNLSSQFSSQLSPCSSEVRISGSSMNQQDGFRRYNIDGMTEVLSALDRIEQGAELTYELLVLETSLFLTGLNLNDQHRDMRLDIDNMSYEELLALEERMGTVSTALTEETLSKCLKSSIYRAARSDNVTAASFRDNEDDVKCSICQEEYREGDEVGRLHCEHRYHMECIQQWLRLKNWCPICKISAEPSS